MKTYTRRLAVAGIVATTLALCPRTIFADSVDDQVRRVIESIQTLRAESPEGTSPLERIAAEVESVESELAEIDRRIAELNSVADPASVWWSFRPLAKPDIPPTSSAWVRTPIDAFILARLESEGLGPNLEADRRTLIRRLTFDLHGLPPTPEEVAAFLADDSPDAYERLVDRLLESPRYGERWGRHWLDVVHYGDTHGYDKDKRRPNAWPYRDYVIESLNQDKPYGRFIEEQVAGDALFPGSPEAIVATGFISAGPWDFVGHVELREGTQDKKITRTLDRDDMVANTMSTFTSLTTHCARCHDHKFDPISQEEYYSLQAVFAGVDRADRPYDRNPAIHRRRTELNRRLAEAEQEKAAVDGLIAEITSEELAALDLRIGALDADISRLSKGEDSPGNGYHSAIESSSGVLKWVQIDLGESKALDRVKLFPARPTDFADTPGFGFPVRWRLLVSDDPAFASPTVVADHTASNYPNPGKEPVEVKPEGATARFVRIEAHRLWERTNDYVFALGEVEVYTGTTEIASGATVTALDSIDSGRWNTAFLVDGYDSRKRIKPIEARDQQKVAEWEKSVASVRADRSRTLYELLPEDIRQRKQAVENSLAELHADLDAVGAPSRVYVAWNGFKSEGSFSPVPTPRPVHLLSRGDVMRPGKEMVPGTIHAVQTLPAQFGLAPDSPEGLRRAALAKWLSDPNNPLTWRSIVNRVWQYHFGLGIVDTPNDFGKMGSAPSHPELLDWLAAEFLRNGQSLKQLHRLMLTSSVYRQSSAFNETAALKDGENRLLWRMNRQRLEAESIRDAVLAVSGELNLSMGGPGFDLFAFIDDHSPHYLYQDYDVNGPKGMRRSVYRFIVRSVPDPWMESFDCADPSQTVPTRSTTITALQALSLLNNPFILAQSTFMADRVKGEAADLGACIDRAFHLCFGRDPSASERETVGRYAEKHGLAAACRILINSNEFVFVD